MPAHRPAGPEAAAERGGGGVHEGGGVADRGLRRAGARGERLDDHLEGSR